MFFYSISLLKSVLELYPFDLKSRYLSAQRSKKKQLPLIPTSSRNRWRRNKKATHFWSRRMFSSKNVNQQNNFFRNISTQNSVSFKKSFRRRPPSDPQKTFGVRNFFSERSDCCLWLSNESDSKFDPLHL